MSNYTGAKCEYCHKVFSDKDDIVVCPECGSPYHRACFEQAGECVNHELHEKGGSWTAASEGEGESDGDIRCPRCGESNPSTGIFCTRCGMPLRFDAGERPFNGTAQPGQSQNGQGFGNNGQGFGMGRGFGGGFGGFGPGQPGNFGMPFQGEQINKDTDIDGNSVGEYVKFAGSNPIYFIMQFIRFAKTHIKYSVNFVALFFTEFYFFYRKMYKQGIIAFVSLTLLSVPYFVTLLGTGMIANVSVPSFMVDNENTVRLVLNICSLLSCGIRVLFGLMANYWYYSKARKTLGEIKNNALDEERKNDMIAKNGGTSIQALIVSVTVYFTVVVAVLMIAVAL